MTPRECCQTQLSTRMVQSIHAVLRNALERAVRQETIPRNVAKLVKVTTPRYKVNRGLTTAQARAVLRTAAEHRLYALYVLALCLGLRRGELLGLRWTDIDLDGEKLEVVQTLQRIGGQLRFVGPKTEDSARTVPLPPFRVNALREHRKHQFTERSLAWPEWDDHGLVFPSRRREKARSPRPSSCAQAPGARAPEPAHPGRHTAVMTRTQGPWARRADTGRSCEARRAGVPLWVSAWDGPAGAAPAAELAVSLPGGLESHGRSAAARHRVPASPTRG